MNDSDTDYLSVQDLLDIAEGILPSVQVRDRGLLESAVARPRITVSGESAYPDLVTQAAALMHSLARNHTLIDGNKRLAWAAMRVFLAMNDVNVTYEIDDAEQLVLRVARGDNDVADIAAWLRTHAYIR